MIDSSLSEKIFQEIKAASKVFIITHRRPDGDTLGAALAWFNFFHKIKKLAVVFSCDAMPENYLFLPRAETVVSDPQFLEPKTDDLILTVDTDVSQTGIEDLLLKHQNKIINIDHHISNTFFGKINLVNFEASSTCEILFYLFQDLDIKLTPDIATCLYSGIYIDTGSFTNAATNFRSLEIASNLLTAGARFRKVTRQIAENRSLNSLRLWGIALNRLRFNKQLKIVTTFITTADLERLSVTEEEIEGIANFLNNLDHPEAKAIMLLREDSDGLRGSLRTTREGIDVSHLAEFFGGGGHKKAAGFHLPGKIIQEQGTWKVV